jgi:hypothetical protein
MSRWPSRGAPDSPEEPLQPELQGKEFPEPQVDNSGVRTSVDLDWECRAAEKFG